MKDYERFLKYERLIAAREAKIQELEEELDKQQVKMEKLDAHTQSLLKEASEEIEKLDKRVDKLLAENTRLVKFEKVDKEGRSRRRIMVARFMSEAYDEGWNDGWVSREGYSLE